MDLVDYRDRASVLVWVMLMGLAAQRFLTLPARAFTATLFGSPITLTITANTVLGVLLAGLVASGTEAVVRAHPRSQRGPRQISRFGMGEAAGRVWPRSGVNIVAERAGAVVRDHWVFWGLPIALITVAVLLLPSAPSLVYWLLGLILTGATLGLSMAGIYYTIEPFQAGYRRARLGMNTLTYGIALVLFLVVYQTRVRSIVSATEVLLVSSLLALELLRGSERPTVLVALYAGIDGLILGQATWALNYWRLDSLTGGLVLLVLFYNVVGLSQHALQGRIRRRVLLEYGLITMAAMALIWEFAP
jgi:intracellular septation protein A